jgi:3-hydroxyacyl-[acyl-carrier-protein] dehydratase
VSADLPDPSAAPAASGAPAEVDIETIQRVIPHRYPFLLVDRVRAVVPGVSCIGVKAVTMNEQVFQGHFPGKPVYPGVLIIEAMAQTAGVLVGLTVGLMDKGAKVYFMGVEAAKFRRMVVPGDTLELHVTVQRGGGKVWRFDGRATVGGELAAEARFTAMLDVPPAA